MSNTEGFLIYRSMVDNFRSLKQTNPEWALEYISALIDYSFDGVVYEGDNIAIKWILNSEMVMIDNQRVRYGKASKGGSAQKVTDEQILEAFRNNDFKNTTDAARYIATNYTPDGKFSRQALEYRLRKMGISFEELSSQNFSNQKTQIICENPQMLAQTFTQTQTQTQTQVNNPTLTPTLTSTSTSTSTSTLTSTDTDNAYSLAQSATVVNKTEEEIDKIRKEYNIVINGWGYSKEQAADYICKQYSISLDEIEYILGDNAAINKKPKAKKKNPIEGLL